MAEGDDLVELLFFDTFSHEINDDINLDLVQFPKPVYITEVRIIPLGARVQADFPGGVRLGATNPSSFGIEFFVNDLGKPGASTFESLGSLEYNQNDCIHLECHEEQIPTDGLVLRGWYTTITLAVYGTLTKNLTEQIASPPPPIEPVTEEVSILPVQVAAVETVAKETPPPWREEAVIPPLVTEVASTFEREVFPEPPAEEVFEQTQYTDDCYQHANPEISREHEKRSSRKKSRSSERSTSRNRTYSHSDSNEREYSSRQKREWSRSPEYRHSRRIRRDKSREVEHTDREHKWPRTPPTQIDSPRRPRSPEPRGSFSDNGEDADFKYRQKSVKPNVHPVRAPIEPLPEPVVEAEEIKEALPIDDDTLSQDEQFEPILSDDEIGDDDNDEQENEDIEMEENYFEEAIKVLDPFKTPLVRFEKDLHTVCFKDLEVLNKIFCKYELQTKTYSLPAFISSTSDEKENFVYISEQLINQMSQISLQSLEVRDFILAQIFESSSKMLKLCASILKIALDFDCAFAQPQPGFKIRHIKIGTRLAELLGVSADFFEFLISEENFDPFQSLFDLYEKDYMALSIKLLILKAIYCLLDTKKAVTTFLNSRPSGYQRLLCIMEGNPLTRVKFSLKAIIKKLNLYEALENIQNFITKEIVLSNHYSPAELADVDYCLKEVVNALSTNALSYQQPKRFLPVSKKFEIVKDQSAYKSWAYMLQSYFKIHVLAESLLLILSNRDLFSATLMSSTYELIEQLIRSPVGVDYVVSDGFETIQLLVKCLLGINNEPQIGTESDAQKELEDEVESKTKISKATVRAVTRSQKLGVEIAFRIQSRYHIDAISSIRDNPDLLIEHLHALYSQTCSHPGQIHTVETIGMAGNIVPFLTLIEKERKIQSQRQQDSPGFKYKSPVLSYSVDLVDCCVRHCTNIDYLVEHGHILLDLVKNHEIFEPSVSAVLQEMSVYLKPLEVISNFSYDDISALCEVIKRSIEYITTFPGDLIMGMRILKHIGIRTEGINAECETKELKYRYVILQFYSADGVLTLLNILEKLNTYFEQPGLHSPTLMTTQAVHTCQIILPTLQILREMLTFVIQCRDTQFKDLTAVEHLMKTYCLMHYYPELSQSYDDAQKIKNEIIKILLGYTQPNPEDEDSVHKSLWTQMIREVIKCILTGPSTFIPGLQAFAELLPLPLPIPTQEPLTEIETQRLITERKLWSAHLHPESALLSELIQTICPSSFPQLSDLLTRVCLQLADLAPNMTLLVSKTVIDLIIAECSNCSSIGTPALARLLRFLGQLTAYASVKISSLSVFSGKLYEYFNQILTNSDTTEAHLECQENIHRILENFFDSEISMIVPNSTGHLELNLACALPSKELIPGVINSILENLLNANLLSGVSMAASRNLIILSEHDVTFYYLRINLINKKEQYQQWLRKVVESYEAMTNKSILDTVVLFLRTLIYIDESSVDSTIPNRTLKLTVHELANIIGWSNIETPHPLRKLQNLLENDNGKNENACILLLDLSGFLANFDGFEPVDVDEKNYLPEPNLPQAEGIVTQYLARPIYTIYEAHDDAQLNANFWLEPIRLESLSETILNQSERISCDLAEMVSTCLPPDTNLSSDCKRVLHLSASPQSNRERTTTAPCFRTRRVEVEPSTGRPEKKLYVSPMRGRGFPRAPPSRGDLFRSRPPNTSRPPSLHVDDFLALETCGAQPTGPTGYNKLSRDIISIRGTRVGRNRGSRIAPVSSAGSYRKSNSCRTGSPSTWGHVSVDPSAPPPPQHFRTATSEPVVTPHFTSDPHYSQPHFGGAPLRSRGRGRARTFLR